MFEVAVGDDPIRVVVGDKTALDVFREGLSPEVGCTVVVEVDPAHTGLGGVRRAQDGRFLRDNFGKVSRAVTQAGGKAAECLETISHEAIHSDPIALGLVLGPLEGAEQASRTRDGYRDKPKAAEEASPLLVVDSLEVGEFFKDLG